MIGGMVMFAPDFTNEMIGKLIGMLADMAGGMDGLDLSTFDLNAFIGDASIGLFVGGVGLMAVAGVGILGSQKKIVCVLIMVCGNILKMDIHQYNSTQNTKIRHLSQVI